MITLKIESILIVKGIKSHHLSPVDCGGAGGINRLEVIMYETQTDVYILDLNKQSECEGRDPARPVSSSCIF